MASKSGNRIIAIEEHYFDPEIVAEFDDKTGFAGTPIRKKMDDLYDLRIKDMDAFVSTYRSCRRGRRGFSVSMGKKPRSWQLQPMTGCTKPVSAILTGSPGLRPFRRRRPRPRLTSWNVPLRITGSRVG